ncbi:MAG: alpha/beta hydrolase [Clostridia bacterium]|nr:alpha/beta hydrolase [Clostridia bacterium]
MKVQKIYKTDEGRQKILNYYSNIKTQITYPYKENYIDTQFGKTYMIEAGNEAKPAVLLFHGSCTNSAMWYSDMKILSEHFHVLSVDILGEPGNSEPVRLDMNGREYALWINEILQKAGIKKASIIGNSLGAWMGLKFGVNFPDRLDKLVLIAPSGLVQPKFSYIFKTIIYAIQGEKGLKKIGKMITGTDEMPEAAMEFNKLVAAHFTPIMGALPLFTDDELAKLSMPVMFLAGENDVINDAKKAALRLTDNVPDPRINIIKNNGHIIYNVMEEIIPFLRK